MSSAKSFAGFEPGTARPIGRRHRPLARWLHGLQLNLGTRRANRDYVALDADLSWGEVVRVARAHRPDLQPIAAKRRPRSGCRRAGARQSIDMATRSRPLDARVIDADLGCERYAVGRLWDGVEPSLV